MLRGFGGHVKLAVPCVRVVTADARKRTSQTIRKEKGILMSIVKYVIIHTLVLGNRAGPTVNSSCAYIGPLLALLLKGPTERNFDIVDFGTIESYFVVDLL